MTQNKHARLSFALRYAGVHFLVTLLIATIVGILVFFIWYPEPFRQMTGGLGLYKLILGVDIVCGPLLTLVLASPKKINKEMLQDIGMIACVQLLALGYGLYTVSQARPVALVAELDRFRVVTQLDVYKEDQYKALLEYQKTPLWGIVKAGVEKAKTPEAANKNLKLSLEGVEMGVRPDLWIPYGQMKQTLKNKAQPLSLLKNITSAEQKKLNQSLSELGARRQEVTYLPVVAPMSSNWIVLLDEELSIIGYSNVNGWQ